MGFWKNFFDSARGASQTVLAMVPKGAPANSFKFQNRYYSLFQVGGTFVADAGVAGLVDAVRTLYGGKEGIMSGLGELVKIDLDSPGITGGRMSEACQAEGKTYGELREHVIGRLKQVHKYLGDKRQVPIGKVQNKAIGLGETFLRHFLLEALKSVEEYGFKRAYVLLGWLAYGDRWRVEVPADVWDEVKHEDVMSALQAPGLLACTSENAYGFWKYFIGEDLTMVRMDLTPAATYTPFRKADEYIGWLVKTGRIRPLP